jgi:hypothetical protein
LFYEFSLFVSYENIILKTGGFALHSHNPTHYSEKKKTNEIQVSRNSYMQVFSMKMTTAYGRVSPAGRISTVCSQRMRTHYLIQHHYDFIVQYRETESLMTL